jgi:glyoxylate/hydroxypyruvate reductase A
MYVCFRPLGEIDHTHWVPALREALGDDHTLAIWPDCEAPERIDCLISWGLREGDAATFSNLKLFHGLSAGLDKVLRHPERRPHWRLLRMIEPGLTQAMAEYVLAYVMRLHREMDDNHIYLHMDQWALYIPSLAHERRIGILGFGELGQACAKTLYQTGFDVAAWSRSRKDSPYATSCAGEGEFSDLLERSDILINLLPLTPETEDILSADLFAQLPEKASIINVARGAHLVETDLLQALDSGKLSRAVLDVFRDEPLPGDHPFWTHERIIMTPHTAAQTIPRTGAHAIARTLAMIENGEQPEAEIDPDRGY